MTDGYNQLLTSGIGDLCQLIMNTSLNFFEICIHVYWNVLCFLEFEYLARVIRHFLLLMRISLPLRLNFLSDKLSYVLFVNL